MTIHKCSNPATWHPTLHRTEMHHNPPKSWTLDGGDSAELVRLCGLCHNELHALLNLYVRAGGTPPWVDPVKPENSLRTFGVFIRWLAAKAWDARIPGKTPYTSVHGVIDDAA